MLMARIPVITTAVGDLGLYLKSGFNAYLFEESDVNQLVRYIQTILSQPQEAEYIAKRGQDVALDAFNPIVQGKRLSDFIHGFYN